MRVSVTVTVTDTDSVFTIIMRVKNNAVLLRNMPDCFPCGVRDRQKGSVCDGFVLVLVLVQVVLTC